MARQLRIEYPGAVYHVMSRGNEKRLTFFSDTDRADFLRILAAVVGRRKWLCHAYCLMPNHYHLLIETPHANLSAGMQYLNSVYSMRFNRRNARMGHVFQGRFKALLVERDNYLIELCRYIVLNPVRAKMVKHPGLYRWSSFLATAGQSLCPPFLSRDWVLAQFNATSRPSADAYTEFVLLGTDAPAPWPAIKNQLFLGSDEFVRQVTPLIDSDPSPTEIPRAQRFADRPSLETHFAATHAGDRRSREAAIQRAVVDFGYTQSDVAAYLGIHYSTVSKILKNSRFKI